MPSSGRRSQVPTACIGSTRNTYSSPAACSGPSTSAIPQASTTGRVSGGTTISSRASTRFTPTFTTRYTGSTTSATRPIRPQRTRPATEWAIPARP